MKKIVAVASLASLLIGATFAADISFSYTGSNFFKSSGGNLAFSDRTDCMSVTLKNDTAGAVLDFDTDVDAKTFKQDAYYGWMNFAIPTGNLEITAGCWESRYVQRVNTDAGKLKGADFEKYKPGVINGVIANDADNLTQKKISMVAAYTNADALPGKLLVKFGLVNSTYNPDADAATTAENSGDVTDGGLSIKAGFVGEIGYRQDDLINLNFAVKNYERKSFSLGLWASPLMVENLELTVGGAFGIYKPWDTTPKDWNENTGKEWGVDLRARYVLNEEISVTTMHNLSSGYDKTADNNQLNLWDMVSVAYKFDPRMTIGCTINAEFDNLDSDHTFTGADVTTSPYLVIRATERVSITSSLRCAVTGWNPKIDGHETFDVTVPVIFAFKL